MNTRPISPCHYDMKTELWAHFCFALPVASLKTTARYSWQLERNSLGIYNAKRLTRQETIAAHSPASRQKNQGSGCNRFTCLMGHCSNKALARTHSHN